MNLVKQLSLILAGSILAFALIFSAGAARADDPGEGRSSLPGAMMDGFGMAGPGMMGGRGWGADDHGPGAGRGAGMMAGRGHMGAMQGGAMHGGAMHGGDMPEACEAMMDDPAMMPHMMQMMHGGEPMEPAECQAWMDEHEVPAEHQAECLAHMAEIQQP